MDTYTNLGPITDLCVVDLERQGQGQVVTTSGVGADGTLRIVRNGIGINEQATVEVPGIKGMWSLRRNTDDPFDEFLLVTFISETRLLVRACLLIRCCSYHPRCSGLSMVSIRCAPYRRFRCGVSVRRLESSVSAHSGQRALTALATASHQRVAQLAPPSTWKPAWSAAVCSQRAMD